MTNQEEESSQEQKYVDLMVEIKSRIAVINECLARPVLAPRFMYELCYLQLRMICECIALACLVAHDDLSEVQTSRARKLYHAADIISKLEKLRPEFYPRPVLQVAGKGTDENHLMHEDLKEPFLDKNKLIQLYGQCGDILHKGSIKKMTSKRTERRSSQEIVKWRDLIVALLNTHTVKMLDDGEKLLFTVMRREGDGKINTQTLEWVKPT